MSTPPSPRSSPRSVDSEVGVLREVIVHRPGRELARLTPANVGALQFHDVLWAERAREEHDLFAQQLVDSGAVVHHFRDLLVEALDRPGARSFLVEHVTTPGRFGRGLAQALARMFSEASRESLADVLLGGLTQRDVGSWLATPSLLLRSLEPDDFLMAPLPHQIYQRDSSAWIHGAVSISSLAGPSRRRETVNMRLVYGFHPLFTAAPPTFVHGNDDGARVHATVEGGDLAVLGAGVVMVGMSGRTTPQGVETLAERLFETATAHRVLVVELPRGDAFMHLDSAITQVDRDAFSVYPYLPEATRTWLLTPAAGGRLGIREHHDLGRALTEVLPVDRVRLLRAPMERLAAEHEQWDDGNNFLAVRPGVVLGYDRNTTTNRYLGDNGILVVPVVGSELGRGRGGPRCMTCPIDREA